MTPLSPYCADCGLLMDHVERRSYYFARPQCETCHYAEAQRPKADAERWVLERMYAQPAVPPVSRPRIAKGKG